MIHKDAVIRNQSKNVNRPFSNEDIVDAYIFLKCLASLIIQEMHSKIIFNLAFKNNTYS